MKEMATHSNIFAWRIPWTDRGAWWAIFHGFARIGHDLVTKPPQIHTHTHTHTHIHTHV